MKVSDLIPLPSIKTRFALSDAIFIPKCPGCYVLTTFDFNILYIGLSTNLNTRFIQHLNNSEKISPTLDGRAIWYHYEKIKTEELHRVERTWMNKFNSIHGRNPILNKISSPLQ